MHGTRLKKVLIQSMPYVYIGNKPALLDDRDLENIEFVTLPSGGHSVQQDQILFRTHSGFYGVAVFANGEGHASFERGARMMSLGIITDLRTWSLNTEIPDIFINDILKKHLSDCLDLRVDYDALKCLVRVPLPIEAGPSETSHTCPNLSRFVQLFGIHVFTLWKYALLKKRILFYGRPPVSVLCDRVRHVLALLDGVPRNHARLQPWFYVNLHDIDRMTDQDGFIACTTDSIFKSKPDTYDVYFDGTAPIYPPTSHGPAYTASETDRKRYVKMDQECGRQLYFSDELAPSSASEDGEERSRSVPATRDRVGKLVKDHFRRGYRRLKSASQIPPSSRPSTHSPTMSSSSSPRPNTRGQGDMIHMHRSKPLQDFIYALNTRLFTYLDELVSRGQTHFGPAEFDQLGLHPFYDREFMKQLVRVYGVPLRMGHHGASVLRKVGGGSSSVHGGGSSSPALLCSRAVDDEECTYIT